MAKSFTKTLASYLSLFTARRRVNSPSSRFYATAKIVPARSRVATPSVQDDEEDAIPSEGISRPLSEILRELNKKVPDSVIKVRTEDNFAIKYVPWHIVNRIMNLHAPEWSGEVRNIVYSPDGKSVSVVYRVTIYGTDAENLFH